MCLMLIEFNLKFSREKDKITDEIFGDCFSLRIK